MLAAVHLINALLMIAIPLVLGVFLARRYQLSWSLFGVGAVTFVAAQLLHIPFNNLILTPLVAERGMVAAGGVAFAVTMLLYGLSAGVFEEGARYIVMRRWVLERRGLPEALMFGAGHGGGEAIILGGTALYGFFNAVALRGADRAVLAEIFAPGQVEMAAAQIALYWGMPWYQALLGAVERAGALCFHLSASVLVLKSVRKRRWGWLAAAITWHAVFNAATLVVMDRWGVYAAEGAVVVGAGISLALLFALKRGEVQGKEIDGQGLEVKLPPLAAQRIRGEDATDENLENSRYA